nr:hypothetical protein [Deltaproteobacteria bacterium]
MLRRFLDGIVRGAVEGKTVAFAVRDRASGALIGLTRFMNIDAPNRRVEIGSTWYTRRSGSAPGPTPRPSG